MCTCVCVCLCARERGGGRERERGLPVTGTCTCRCVHVYVCAFVQERGGGGREREKDVLLANESYMVKIVSIACFQYGQFAKSFTIGLLLPPSVQVVSWVEVSMVLCFSVQSGLVKVPLLSNQSYHQMRNTGTTSRWSSTTHGIYDTE